MLRQTALLTFHPTSSPLYPPYTLDYSDQSNSYTQTNVQDGVSFPVPVNPVVTSNYPLLKITDASNCSTEITGVSAVIQVNKPATFSITPDTGICIGSTAQLRVSGGNNYAWSPAAYLDNPYIPNPVASPPQKTPDFMCIRTGS